MVSGGWEGAVSLINEFPSLLLIDATQATRSNLPLHVLLLPRPLSPHDLGMALQVVVVSKRSTTTTAVPLLSQSVRNQFDAKKIEWDDEVDSMERRRSGMQGGYRRIPAPIGDGGMYI